MTLRGRWRERKREIRGGTASALTLAECGLGCSVLDGLLCAGDPLWIAERCGAGDVVAGSVERDRDELFSPGCTGTLVFGRGQLSGPAGSGVEGVVEVASGGSFNKLLPLTQRRLHIRWDVAGRGGDESCNTAGLFAPSGGEVHCHPI